ncbi:hypothetical protein BDY21DRAFT_348859 [Lineolata rhizophorae]|uniref:Uncharacterized protein n=1 Tax=Lineolata rhizophorae TaxID=578093 RepID=A0A6A6NVN2_9PEZI|nr:hypothetical protein BDY21DRAFT_348859 [Lineolata rhizophorae]
MRGRSPRRLKRFSIPSRCSAASSWGERGGQGHGPPSVLSAPSLSWALGELTTGQLPRHARRLPGPDQAGASTQP